ncbi:PIN domain-containing protein [Blastochloris viridis]|uniref:Ribonuclease VapC n=1 Tax=Blastochloris viridis TaxID=1079 RepID=A0A0H5BDV8_BLAVI|nr:PIN domain-containing protein [Blastochloris viridis]ALK08204.1 tRNA(fMet)-specific endonuclease VapC [Blastochloris viridis]BAR98531.1 PIN domain protein [Blastochloris viridis]CUU44126.1 putative nucleic-acid-binding protein, contains PIN domain [Blastochloris viridis]
MRFVDTNILLYSISRAPAEARKRQAAEAILDHDDLALSVQVLQEFYVQATRTSRADPLPCELAVTLIRSWLRFPVQEITLPVLAAALDIHARHRLSYWDAAIIAAASALGCHELLSEDMAHGQRIADVAIVNPFRV